MLAESLDMAQKQQKLSIAANYSRIIEQTQLGLAGGVKPDFAIYKRLGAKVTKPSIGRRRRWVHIAMRWKPIRRKRSPSGAR